MLKKMRQQVVLISCGIVFFAAGPSHAAVSYDGSGHISSISGVSVTAAIAEWGSTGPGDLETRYFDVTFESGTYPDVYGTSTGLPAGWIFNTATRATAAATGLADALNDQAVPGTALFAGGRGEPFIPFYVGPYTSSSSSCTFCVQYRQVDYQGSPADWRDPGTSWLVTLAVGATWAKFTEITTPVPEPEIYAMLGVGLGFMGWVARRRKQQAA